MALSRSGLLSLVAGFGLLAAGGNSVAQSGPEESIKSVLKGIAAGKVGPAWEAIPAKWQGDVQKVYAAAMEAQDAEVWAKSHALVGKLVKVLRSKKDVVLSHPQVGALEATLSKEAIGKLYSAVVDLLAVFNDDAISTLDKAKALKAAAVLETAGNKVLGILLSLDMPLPPEGKKLSDEIRKIGDAKVTAKVEGSTATVSVAMPGKDDAKEETWTKVEGKWVPKELAEKWDEGIEKASKELTKGKGEVAKNKPKLLEVMGELDGGLDRMAKAETAEQLQQIGVELIPAIMKAAQPADPVR